MKKQLFLTLVVALGFPLIMTLVLVCEAEQPENPDGLNPDGFVAPAVFQAAGPTASSIQSTVDAFRAALGEPNNADNPSQPTNNSSQPTGRREINWDPDIPGTTPPGQEPDEVFQIRRTTTPPVTPFNVFLNTRGAQFTTPGEGLSQGPTAGGPQGGLAVLFQNSTYGLIFSTFSPLRLFTPVGSNITEALFFIPGTNGATPATVRGFGAVFTDVDQPDGSRPRKKRGNRGASTLIEYFGVDNKVLFSSFVPASPGDGSLSFFGIVFDDARIRRVRITTGDVAPGPDDDRKNDIVVMDDFIYGEPVESTTGSITREVWTGISGDFVSTIPLGAAPNITDTRRSFEAPTNWADHYGTRMRGYITAPATGNYTFWIAGDNNSELWLSLNDNPANKVRIGLVSEWTNSRQWDKYSTQKSATPIPLTAGQRYYVEALQKEGGGGDNLAVGWAKPGESTSAPSEVIPGSVLSQFSGGSQ
jgi:PA14 domain